MTAPAHNVLEGTSGVAPRRPLTDCSDTGGLQFQDAVGANAPRPNEHPSALDFKQMEMLLARVFLNIPALSLDVSWNGATYTIAHVRAFNSYFETNLPTFTKDGATGVHEMTGIPTGYLPTQNGSPFVIPRTANRSISSFWAGLDAVLTVYDENGSATNGTTSFTINIWGE